MVKPPGRDEKSFFVPLGTTTAWFGASLLALGLASVVEGQEFQSSSKEEKEESPLWVTIGSYAGIIVLIILSGICAGLTLGLMSLDRVGLEIIIGAGEKAGAGEDEKLMHKYARRIYPLRLRGNLLLCTLIIFNVAVNALLSILMADLTSGLMGFFISTVTITIFGEIVPQAICTRFALKSGYYGVPIVRVMIVLVYIFAKPLSMVLDKIMGEDLGTIHSASQLKELLQIHVKHKALGLEEAEIMDGAMKFKDKEVRDVMTPASQVYSIPASERLNFKTMSEIFRSGYSRVPVYGKDANDIVGILYTKDLIFVDPEDETPILNFIQIFGRGVIKVWPDSKLGSVLKLFKQGRSHIALVQDVNNQSQTDPFYEFLGVITLEDIIEEILQDEILDETDLFATNDEDRIPVDRHFDFGRLRLLDHRITDGALSYAEVVALTAHLRANHKAIFQGPEDNPLSEELVRNMLRQAPVMELKLRHGPSDELYTLGKPADFALLVLSGKLQIRVGRENFMVEVGPWTLIGGDSLVDPNFVPDFTATIASEKLRVIRIARENYANIHDAKAQGKRPPTPVAAIKGPLTPRVLVAERPPRGENNERRSLPTALSPSTHRKRSVDVGLSPSSISRMELGDNRDSQTPRTSFRDTFREDR